MNKTENGWVWLGHLALALVLALSLLVIPLAVPLLGPTPALAATITTAGSGNWNSTTNNAPWPGGVVPNATDAVVIAAGNTVYIPGGYTGTCGDLNVTGTLTLNNIAGTLQVYGGGTSPVTTGAVSGGGKITGPGSGGTNIVLYGDWSFSGTLTGWVSIYFYGSQDQDTAGGNVTFQRNLFIDKSGGTVYFPVTPTWGNYFHITGDAGTVCYNGGGNQNVAVPESGYSYYNLALAGSGTKTLGSAGAVSVNGTLNVGSGTTFMVSNGITVNGTTTVDGTLTISSTTGTKTFTGDVIINNGGNWSETASESISFGGNLQNDGMLTASTGTHTFTGSTKTFSGANPISIPSVTVSGTYTNNGNLTVSTALDGGGGLTQGTTGTLNINFTGAVGITTLTATASGNTVNYGYAGTQTVKATTYYHLTLSGSGTKTLGGAVTVNGDLTIGLGTILDVSSGNNYTLTVNGDWMKIGTFTPRSGTVTLSGSSAQTMSGATTFYKMTLNNGYGLTINNDETISNTLTLTNGKITTGSYKVIIPAGGSVSGASSSSYVNGNLQKNVATGATTRTFEVGTASGYNPVAVTFASVTTEGNLIAKATSGDHPSIGLSTIDATKSVNVYWSLTNSGIVFTTYGATFNFNNPGDNDTGTNTANFIVGRYSGGWTYPNVGIKTTTSTQATGMTSFGDFAVGEVVAAPTVTTQAATSVEATTATGNGNITATGGRDCDKRGFVYDTSSHGLPGNVAPASSGYASYAEDTGLFGIGDFTKGLTSLSTGTTYYARAYAHNSVGYSYGGEVSFLTKPAAPTNVTATDGTYSDKVVVTWTKSTGATGYIVYRDSTNASGTLGNVSTYNDTGAGAPTITPGSSVASDGTYTDKVALSLSGAGTSNGTTHTYKVVASDASGNSIDSSTDTGYRAPGALTYQWQRSAADSDAGYSNITGATTASYDDIGAPADGSGRYYRCVENAAGASQNISSADRGYRYHPTIEITAPTSITGWVLSPQEAQPQNQTRTLNVTSNGNWTVTVKDADNTTNGTMTEWNGTAYGTIQLANFMKVATTYGGTYNVTLPTEGTIASGSGNASVTVTFKQTVSWSDQVLPGGHSYRIIVTFTGTTIIP